MNLSQIRVVVWTNVRMTSGVAMEVEAGDMTPNPQLSIVLYDYARCCHWPIPKASSLLFLFIEPVPVVDLHAERSSFLAN